MLTKLLAVAVVWLIGFGGLSMTGCQSTNASRDAHGETAAVMCDKCKTTWVRTPQKDGTKITTYASRKTMTCPDCKSAVASFFSTGKLEHTCTACGGELQHCEVHN